VAKFRRERLPGPALRCWGRGRRGRKPIEGEGFFRWTEVQLPLLKQGAPTESRPTGAEYIAGWLRSVLAFCGVSLPERH
jgi:hypothetical protein